MRDPAAPPAEPSISHRLWASMRSVPVTRAIVAVLLVGGAVTGALWESVEGSGLVDTWGWGEQAFEEGRWWTIITRVLIAPTPWMYLLIIAIFVAAGGYLERHYGALKMLLVTLGTHIAAVLTVAGVFWLLRDSGLTWVEELSGISDAGLSNAGFGARGHCRRGDPRLQG